MKYFPEGGTTFSEVGQLRVIKKIALLPLKHQIEECIKFPR